ncbi:glycosyltransferase family 9 protein [Cryobacterium sp.]|jgi:ADP-heptose:LPS heptosyltransferase|uniref:glycosyltransferase family 9 protein n=1 Tax=Cryobacterium sp. TaxID=1926290 RepID=UPI00261B0540|nr:glycosyltransferase family 9 protein [Cryobacterium sp.]MCU1445941.1 glycosyl transferase family 9 [Cryobacterium sp.]
MVDAGSTAALGVPATRFAGVHRIAVLRAGGLGDLVVALPALAALAAAYPRARMTLIGAPAHRRLLAGRPGPVALVEELPVGRGLRAGTEDPVAYLHFLHRLREHSFDLAVQLHGGGRHANPFVLGLGARHTVGMATDDAPALERSLPYVQTQHELFRALEVVALAGAAPVTLESALPVTATERRAASALVPPGTGSLVAIHPGATDPRRRWPLDRFVQVARAALGDGARVIVLGDESEHDLADELVAAAGADQDAGNRPVSLAGALDLSGLVGVLAAADVLVANDSGPRHLAQAVGTATVSLYWIGNLLNAGPLSRARHRVHVSWTMACRRCGADFSGTVRCEHDDSVVAAIPVGPVLADLRDLAAVELRARSRPPRGR